MTFPSKKAALDALEESRREWLEEARTWAIDTAACGLPITIEEVRREGPPLPEGVDPRVCGAVFRCKRTWEFHGYIPGTRKESHSRPVAQYVLRGSV